MAERHTYCTRRNLQEQPQRSYDGEFSPASAPGPFRFPWEGEFGRTPMVQGGNDGRDHHPNAFTMWVAGGGIKPGISFGESDDLGFGVVKDKVHVHDLHATLMHLLGFDHTKLIYRFQGRDFRLTDVHGQVVKGLLA